MTLASSTSLSAAAAQLDMTGTVMPLPFRTAFVTRLGTVQRMSGRRPPSPCPLVP